MNYISYIDKENSLELDSIYIVNADNANEIKLVVNNIIDWLKAESLTISSVFKYAKLNVPELDSEQTYDLIVEISSDGKFENADMVHRLSLQETPRKFKMFKNGVFSNINSRLTSDDFGKSISVDIADFVSDDYTYCRYYFQDLDSRVIEKHTFALGMNDYQKPIEDIPVPVILIDDEVTSRLNLLKSCTKTEALGMYNTLAEFDEIQTYHSYLKFRTVPSNIIQYCNANNIPILSDSLIDVTSASSFSTSNVENAKFRMKKSIECSAMIDGAEYTFNRLILAEKTYTSSYSLKNPNISGSTAYHLSIKKNIKDGGVDLDVYSSEIVISAGLNDGLIIVEDSVSTVGFEQSTDSFIAVSGDVVNEFPIRIDKGGHQGEDENEFDEIRIEIIKKTFNENEISYYTINGEQIRVIGVKSNGEEEDITLAASILVDNEMGLEKDPVNEEARFTLTNDIKDGAHTIIAKYGDLSDYEVITISRKKMTSFESYIYRWNDDPGSMLKYAEITPNADAVQGSADDKNDNWLHLICIAEYNDGSIESGYVPLSSITISNPVVEAGSSNENGSYLDVSKIPGKTYRARSIITVTSGDMSSDCFIDVSKTRLQKLIITESTGANTLSVGSNYTLSISGIYETGEIKDLSNSQYLSLALSPTPSVNGDSLTNNTSLSISSVKYSRPIVVNGIYNDTDDYATSVENFYVVGYGFVNTIITDNDPLLNDLIMRSGEVRDYYTFANYDNGASTSVSANYKLTDVDSHQVDNLRILTWSVSNDKKKVTIATKPTLSNKHFEISSHYAEPGYEGIQTEMCDTTILITISSGFDISLSGDILTAIDETNYDATDFESTIFLSAINPNEFIGPSSYTHIEPRVITGEYPDVSSNVNEFYHPGDVFLYQSYGIAQHLTQGDPGWIAANSSVLEGNWKFDLENSIITGNQQNDYRFIWKKDGIYLQSVYATDLDMMMWGAFNEIYDQYDPRINTAFISTNSYLQNGANNHPLAPGGTLVSTNDSNIDFVFEPPPNDTLYDKDTFNLTHEWIDKIKVDDNDYKNLKIMDHATQTEVYDIANYASASDFNISLSTNTYYDYLFYYKVEYSPEMIEVTPEILSKMSTDDYHLVRITDGNGFEVIIPRDCLTPTPTYISADVEYEYTFYNMLSTNMCEDNDYDKAVSYIDHYTTMTTKTLDDVIPGNLDYYDSITVENLTNGTIANLGPTDSYSFRNGNSYNVEATPINAANGSVNTYKEFPINKQVQPGEAFAVQHLTAGPGIQILNAMILFETSSGKRYKQLLMYEETSNSWVVTGPAYEAATAVSILVAMAFPEEIA